MHHWFLGGHKYQPKRHHRISSDKSSVAEEVILSSSRQRGDSNESEAEGVDGLLCKKYQVEEELERMKLKMEAMEWDTRVRIPRNHREGCSVIQKSAA